MVDVVHDQVEEILAKSDPVPLPEGGESALEKALNKAIEDLKI